jgi:hypothetical protein
MYNASILCRLLDVSGFVRGAPLHSPLPQGFYLVVTDSNLHHHSPGAQLNRGRFCFLVPCRLFEIPFRATFSEGMPSVRSPQLFADYENLLRYLSTVGTSYSRSPQTPSTPLNVRIGLPCMLYRYCSRSCLTFSTAGVVVTPTEVKVGLCYIKHTEVVFDGPWRSGWERCLVVGRRDMNQTPGQLVLQCNAV